MEQNTQIMALFLPSYLDTYLLWTDTWFCVIY